jgi:hypothetical protein
MSLDALFPYRGYQQATHLINFSSGALRLSGVI